KIRQQTGQDQQNTGQYPGDSSRARPGRSSAGTQDIPESVNGLKAIMADDLTAGRHRQHDSRNRKPRAKDLACLDEQGEFDQSKQKKTCHHTLHDNLENRRPRCQTWPLDAAAAVLYMIGPPPNFKFAVLWRDELTGYEPGLRPAQSVDPCRVG